MDNFPTFRKFNADRWKTYLHARADGCGRNMAAKACGLSLRTIQNILSDYPELQQQEYDAEKLCWEKYENALFRSATEKLNPTSIIFALLNHPEVNKWADKRATANITQVMDANEVEQILLKELEKQKKAKEKLIEHKNEIQS